MKIALLTDIHGNLEALKAIIDDIKKRNIDRVVCLGDTINFGPNSKECIDMLIDNNIDMTLGDSELYCINKANINYSIANERTKHYEWVKSSLTDKELNYIKKCPMYYECNINYEDSRFDKKLIFCHYLIRDETKEYPFEHSRLDKDINLWIKYNDEKKEYFVGHLHYAFNINNVDGILGDYIKETQTLTNINVLESAGCSKNNKTSYMMLDIGKSIKFKKIELEYDREKFVFKIKSIDFPDKKSICKHFFRINIET